MLKKLAVVAVSLLTAAVGVILPAVPAQAASSCSGSMIAYSNIKTSSGTVVGEIAVYYNSATGYNCARYNHRGPTYGVASQTMIRIERCHETTNRNQCTTSFSDPASWESTSIGNFAYYAGPVQVYAPNNCVYVEGYVTYAGREWWPSLPVALGC
ncbi:MAG TPA: hypothetical protein VFM86_13155 [Pedococcus sp.]|nr:hypothetical protein [Pedococcus sp.]